MAREFGRNMPGRCRVPRQIVKRRAHGVQRRIGGIGDPQNGLCPRFGPPRAIGSAVLERPGHAGQQFGQLAHVRLGIGPVDTQRMQFEDLAREILVQPATAVAVGRAVRPDRVRLVQKTQHHRMRGNGKKHVGKRACHVRADRPLDVGRDQVRGEPHA